MPSEEYFKHERQMRDLTQFQCPHCGKEDSSGSSRVCKHCGYQGDWIQPGEVMLYKDNIKFLGRDSIAALLPQLKKAWEEV